MGGLQLACDHCQHQQQLYFSCRDRHCPSCQGKATEQWTEKQRQQLLPLDYYHLVFTLPHSLNGWVQLHPRDCYALLFESAWHSLSTFGKKRLQGRIGMTAVLHTWGQNLSRHVHLHCLIPGGALSEKGHWQTNKAPFLFPVKALSRHFRGRFVSRLRQRIDEGGLSRLGNKQQIKTILDGLMQQPWVVYAKACIGHTESVVGYLARYTHRIAISNARILDIDPQGSVQLSYKDHRDQRPKVMTLKGTELIRRFLQHVLPAGFMRVRHFGFLANACREKRLSQIRAAIGQTEEIAEKPTDEGTAPFSGFPCTQCQGGKLLVISEIAPERAYSG
jgi:hypothetical protein